MCYLPSLTLDISRDRDRLVLNTPCTTEETEQDKDNAGASTDNQEET
jgi:hypothetical protein